MNNIFGEIKRHIHTTGLVKPQVSSGVFSSLKAAMLVTLLSCIIVTARTYIGENIKCITGFERQEHQAIETYCFISGTFTVPDTHAVFPHPGVGPFNIPPKAGQEGETPEEVTIHSYYQWVPMVLALQAGLFFFPKWFWTQVIDRDFFQNLIQRLDKVHVLKSEYEDMLKSSAAYFVVSLNTHMKYAILHLLTEAVAVTIAIGNLFFTNRFLGGEFFSYGPDAIKYINSPANDPNNPLNLIFPKVAKCTWYKYGPTGSIQTHDALCVLPLNIVNEKTYIFLWVTFIGAAIVATLIFLWHVLLIFLPSLRFRLLTINQKQEVRIWLSRVSPICNYGDWFLMSHLKRNMVYFSEWLKEVYEIDKALNNNPTQEINDSMKPKSI